MHPIIIKYAGDCRKCGTGLAIGAEAVHEKHVGLFCPACAPTDSEEIRKYRQEAANRRADKYEEWAGKRRQRAEALHIANEPYRGDIAFNTQPGHIPLRDRVIRRTEQAWEHSATAARFEGKAESLRHVRVAGDAANERQAKRDAMDSLVSKGSRVFDFAFGGGYIIAMCKKSYRIKFDSGGTYARDKSYVKLEEVKK